MNLRDRMERSDPIWRRLVRRAFGVESKGLLNVRVLFIPGGSGLPGNFDAPGIKKGDHLVAVISEQNHATTLGLGDLTSGFSILRDGVITNSGSGHATTANTRLHVYWEAFDEEDTTMLKDRMKRSDPIWRRIVRRAFGAENKGFVMVQAVDGGAAGNHTVSKIKNNDHLVSVIATQNHATTLGAGDLTSEFTLAGDGVINNTGGTATTDMRLHVIWEAFDGE